MCVCVCVCGSVISSSFKSCHRPDTIVRRGFHRLTSDVPVIQSNYTERNRYCYTLGIDSRQNRKSEDKATQSSAAMRHSLARRHTHTHSRSHAQIRNHMGEQLQYLSDNKSLQGNTASLPSTVGSVWQVGYSNLKWWGIERCTSASASLSGWWTGFLWR